ncbi:SDR family NAD(P)-dependent oxidoreductase [Pseudomonas viridiflava]|uniref:SDR family NAD(P)-dependent oxidoreductase n=1 Tax=Pseudomonas viridiflava TaxID=33069 RepID=UPI0023F75485|nr:SDR family NAD(P)-dependent oxidoreductase [Pseudomonas viridiflava]
MYEQVQDVLKNCGDIDVLINNAGINRQQRFLNPQASDAAAEEMAVNYFGTLSMCRAFAPVLIGQRGAIVNVLSILARVTIPLMGSLCASKAASLRMTEGIRAELAQDGVQVLAVLPGVIDTSMSRDFPGPKATPAAIAAAIVNALNCDATTLYPDLMSEHVAARLDQERNEVVAEFAAYL